MRSLTSTLAVCGSAFSAAVIGLAVTQALIGTPLFFAFAAIMAAAYVTLLARVWNEREAPRPLLLAALALALAFRVPLALPPVGPDSDLVRYVWDGRVQRLDLNPYLVVPADPALAYTHTDETRQMPSRNWRTPYPPGAQLFFGAVSWLHDSTLAMKLALVVCDMLTIVVIRRWLRAAGRSEWLTVAYAWNPLVVLEVAHSGHIDALGALWIALAALALTTRKTMVASTAFVVAVSIKLLPIVLAPLFWRRVRPRDVVLAAAFGVGILWPYLTGPVTMLGALPNVIAGVRFNGPVFRLLADVTWPQVAAGFAVAAGLAAAAWCRWKLPVDNPAAWAWPMAIAVVCAPVIYPWYLLYLTPFLLASATLPLTVWTLSILPAYVVWELARTGGRWVVPGPVLMVQYAAVLVAIAFVIGGSRRRQLRDRDPVSDSSGMTSARTR